MDMNRQATTKQRKVAVLMGGTSAEREVSQRSGAAIAKGLRAKGWDVAEVDVRSRGLDGLPDAIDVAFIALHGEFGEDGQIQRLLERRGVRYTGSSPEASEAAFDKRRCKRILAGRAIPTPAYEVLKAGQPRGLPLPVVLKPPCQGSSIGVHRVFREGEWDAAFGDASRYGDEVLVEAYIQGRELTVGIVGGQCLPVVEIIAPGDCYDYGAKYTPGKTRYVVPAELDGITSRRCQDAALRTFEALGCRGMGRVDIRLGQDGVPYVLELNSIPGFTELSLLPKAAAAAGIAFPDLCHRIAESALA